MELLLKGVAAGLVLLVARAQVQVLREAAPDQRRLLESRIGQHLRIVGGAGPQLKGLVRRVDRHAVSLRVVGAEVRVPFDQIAEVWQGRQLLARW